MALHPRARCIIAAVVTAWRAPGRFRALAERAARRCAAVLPGIVVGLVLGYALNDSGIAVPGMMLAVMVPAVVYLMSPPGRGSQSGLT